MKTTRAARLVRACSMMAMADNPFTLLCLKSRVFGPARCSANCTGAESGLKSSKQYFAVLTRSRRPSYMN